MWLSSQLHYSHTSPDIRSSNLFNLHSRSPFPNSPLVMTFYPSSLAAHDVSKRHAHTNRKNSYSSNKNIVPVSIVVLACLLAGNYPLSSSSRHTSKDVPRTFKFHPDPLIAFFFLWVNCITTSSSSSQNLPQPLNSIKLITQFSLHRKSSPQLKNTIHNL